MLLYYLILFRGEDKGEKSLKFYKSGYEETFFNVFYLFSKKFIFFCGL